MAEKKKIKVLVVDDQALILDILSKNLVKDPMIEVVGTATDGYLALNMINRTKPDVILLDLEMPRMNGIQFLHNLMPVNPIPTIVLSALTDKDSKITVDAFEAGAVDFQPKPSGGARGLPQMLNRLWVKIKMAATQDVRHLKKTKKDYTLPKNALDRKAKTNQIVLGMGALEVTNEPGRILKIFALGSCVGLTMICPGSKTIGMAHVVLPNSTTDLKKSEALPGYFADSAVSHMLSMMKKNGCSGKKIYAKIAGGAKTKVDIGDYFGVGQRNSIAVKAALLKQGVKVVASDIGGNISRTVSIQTGKTKVSIYYPDKGTWEI
jgi:chemotaxis receptor (MCP) glutamine deamidase CheD/ActR/RegA family two-component response regulator